LQRGAFLLKGIISPMEKLARDAQTLFGIHLTKRQVELLTIYERELLDWNQKFNLTAIRDSEGIRTKHFLDSFSCSLAWKDQTPRRLIDVGTGAGFPGIVLKILYPTMKLTLVESVGKKANFCGNPHCPRRRCGTDVRPSRKI
jgi:16S rRNA (guanine527-N7)-methyltransferase